MAEPAAAPVPPGRRALVGLLLLAAALRLLSWQRATMMTNDGPDFLWQAQRLLDGDAAAALAHPYHPGYAAFAAGAALLTRDVLAGALLVSVLAGVLATWAAVAAARELWPARPGAALGAGLLACVHGASLSHTADVRSDGLYLALFAGACALLLAAAQRGGWRWAAAGLAAGLAYLTRPEGLFLVLPAALALAGVARMAGARRARAGGAMFLAGLALLSLPYLAFIRQHTGTWAISMKPSLSAAGLAGDGAVATLPPGCPLASALVPRADRSPAAPGATEAPSPGPAPAAASGVEPVGDPAAARAPAPPAAGDAAREIDEGDARRGLSPGQAGPARALAEAARTFASAARWDVIALAALGAALAWRERRRTLLAGLLVLAAWLAASALHARASGYLGQRHMLGPVQLLFPVAGLGLLALWETRRLRVPARVVVGGIVLLAAFGGAKDRHRDDAARLRALELARGATTPDQALVVHRRKDGWYAQRPVVVVELPCRDEDLAATMARENAVLLVLEEDQLRRDAPHWLDGSRFAEVARFTAGDEVALVLQPRD